LASYQKLVFTTDSLIQNFLIKTVRYANALRCAKSELGTGAASFLKQVHETRRPLVITQHGKGVGVLLDVGEYEAMQEKIEVLQDIHTAVT
jgi:prevent-host-death family protein